jgi:hypothetical protein
MSDMALRHRNYEKEIAAWYTAILSAIFGLVLSSRLQASTSGIAQPLSENRFVQVILALVVLTIALSSSYSIGSFTFNIHVSTSILILCWTQRTLRGRPLGWGDYPN